MKNIQNFPRVLSRGFRYFGIPIFCLLFLSNVFGSLPPHFQDLNEIDKKSKEIDQQSMTEDEKKDLQELQRKTENMLLFRKGDGEILKKYPDAVIRETENSKIKFFLAKDHKAQRQIIVIRESDNLKNWIINFTFWKAKDFWTNIKLHKGFLIATREIFWDVVFHLEPEYATEVYGHSLGGACSVILAMFLDEFGHPDVTVLSTGQPRVTDSKNARPFAHIPYERFTTTRDLVTHLPPRFLNYRHFGKWFLLRKENGGWMNDTKDPKEAIDLWNQWTKKGFDEGEAPKEVEPEAAQIWTILRPKIRPKSMKELFESPTWKYLISMMKFSDEIEHTPPPMRTMEAQEEDESLGQAAQKPEDNPRGGLIDWIRYHNIILYRAKIKEMLDAYAEEEKPTPEQPDQPDEIIQDPPQLPDTGHHPPLIKQNQNQFYLPVAGN